MQASGATCYLALSGYLQALMGGCPYHATESSMLNLMIKRAIGPGKMQAQQVQTSAANLMIAGYL